MTTPKDTPTEFGPQVEALAYAHEALDYPDDPDDPRRSWRATFGIGAGLFLGGVAAAFALGLGLKPPSDVVTGALPATSQQQEAPPSAPAPAWSAPAPAPAHKDDPDTVYLKLFAEESGLRIDDPVPVIALGHQECAQLAEPGATMSSVIAVLQSQYQKVTSMMAYGIVDAAIKAYCPQYGAQ